MICRSVFIELRKSTSCSWTKRFSTSAGHIANVVLRRFSSSNNFLDDSEFLLPTGMGRNFAFSVARDIIFSSTFFSVMVGMAAFL